MSAVALTRLTLPSLDLVGLTQLGDRLARSMGYGALRTAHAEQQLISVMYRHNAMPFVQQEVEDYKRTKQKEVGRWWDSSSPRWIKNNIRHYPLPIPIDVLAKIDLIQRDAVALGLDPRFGIDYLGTVDYEYQARILEEALDPFVYVYMNDGEPPLSRYYFEVWDEPGFIRKEK